MLMLSPQQPSTSFQLTRVVTNRNPTSRQPTSTKGYRLQTFNLSSSARCRPLTPNTKLRSRPTRSIQRSGTTLRSSLGSCSKYSVPTSTSQTPAQSSPCKLILELTRFRFSHDKEKVSQVKRQAQRDMREEMTDVITERMH